MLVMLGNAFYPTIFIKTNILRNQKQLNLKFNQGCLMQKKKFTLIKITFCGYIKHDLLVCSDWMFVGQLVWLAGWKVSWLAGWLVGWLAGWLVGWLAGWLVGWLAGWLVGWLVGLIK